MSKKSRSRFPATRIKRIMQTDEDVGKISKDTPVLVSRGLELFIQDLVAQSASQAKEQGSSLLHPCYLKQCVKGNEIWDFLEEIVKDLPEVEPEAKKKGKGKKEKEEGEDADAGDEEQEEEEEAPEDDT